MNALKAIFTTLLLFTCSLCAFAQVKKATVKDLSFMTGTWVQKAEWGDLEEIWSAPNGESMVSSFRCIKDGKALFYEFMVIEQEGDLPVMKMRHFNRGNVAWEDKNSPLLFPLFSLETNKAIFATPDQAIKLSYILISSTKLDVILEEKDKEGKPKKDIFNFTLKP